MKKFLYECDCCHKEIYNKDNLFTIFLPIEGLWLKPTTLIEEKEYCSYDLCWNCFTDLRKTLNIYRKEDIEGKVDIFGNHWTLE